MLERKSIAFHVNQLNRFQKLFRHYVALGDICYILYQREGYGLEEEMRRIFFATQAKLGRIACLKFSKGQMTYFAIHPVNIVNHKLPIYSTSINV